MTGKTNGRLNSAYIWGLYSTNDLNGIEVNSRRWDDYLDYEVTNDIPELLESYHGMAWSCLTRNRDNNGNGVIDRSEVRWYLAASNQITDMWIGNNSLSTEARLYRPAAGQWRAHIITSTGIRTSWAEEGGGSTEYGWDFGATRYTWKTQEEASRGESVRCLRNIGTYNSEGTLTDISEAPYTVNVENFFSITPEPSDDDPVDTHYTFHFDRLNPKSLRSLSLSELPYHDQFSPFNGVYLKMETQSRAEEVDPDVFVVNPSGSTFVSAKDINNIVTEKGYNPFCPPGYRFPNQSELILMSLYLPEKYLCYDKNGERLSGRKSSEGKSISQLASSRTYFDRGLYGKNTTGFEYDPYADDPKQNPTAREQSKVGWCYDPGQKITTCAGKDRGQTFSRCVRDIDMTGTIEGGILMKEEAYPGDATTVSLSFNATGSPIISAALKFCYTDGSGSYHERDIPVQGAPNGFQFLTDQTFTLPSHAALGLTEGQLDANDCALRKKTKIKVTLRNAFTSETFEQPFYLGNPLDGSLKVNYGGVFAGEDGDIALTMTSKANSLDITQASVSLHYTDTGGAGHDVPLYASSSLSTKELRLSPAIPAVSAPDYDKPVTITATFRDAEGHSKTLVVDDAVFLSSHILDCGVDFPSEFTDEGLPVRSYFKLKDGYTASATLQYKKSGASGWTDLPQITDAASMNARYYTDDTADYAYRLHVSCSDGTEKTSPERRMQIVRLDYTPNPEPAGGFTSVSQCNRKWSDSITGLDFSRGDYIEVDMDLSKCRYIYVNGNKKNDIGLDNILGFSTDKLSDIKNTVILYYPAAQNLNSDPAKQGTISYLIHAGDWSDGTTGTGHPAGLLDAMNVILDKDGLVIDGARYTGDPGEWLSKVKGTLTSASKILVGSEEGVHKSRATYNYIRVVRN